MNSIKICIVGSGPAGFYAAQHLLKKLQNCKIDLFEKLPVPYGLVRYGVAPDHPEVKNVINTFKKTASHPNFNFFGNISLGCDINIKQLQDAYHIVLLAYGASKDKKLGIPGESLNNVLSARKFVGWYNGSPEDQDLNPSLKPSVTILGQGNVAIDVARILLTPIDQLKKTDITEKALNILSKSSVQEVNIVGRRGPLQAAFTIKELREMLKLSGCTTLWRENDFDGIEELISKLPRPRKRITELMINSLKSQTNNKKMSDKLFFPIFFRSPIDISESSVKLAKTMLIGDNLLNVRAVNTPEIEFLKTDLVIRSIGYQSLNMDPLIPFNANLGLIENEEGRVLPGIYTTGWLGHGPTGVILTTMNNSFAVANNICNDINNNPSLNSNNKPGFEYIFKILKQKNVQIVKWNDWEKIDEYEVSEGNKLGKCREKVTDINKMLNITS